MIVPLSAVLLMSLLLLFHLLLPGLSTLMLITLMLTYNTNGAGSPGVVADAGAEVPS